MDEHRKTSYRLLLYHATLEIRCIQWIANRPLRLLNPFHLRRHLRQIARAGALADWLHNLAQHSAYDFNDFDENWFWKDYDQLQKGHPGEWVDYRERFERFLRGR